MKTGKALGSTVVVVLAAIIAGALAGGSRATHAPPPSTVTLTPISTAFNGVIGIDHHSPTNRVAVSVNYPSGLPYNFELVAADGTHSQFSTASGFTDEVKIATVRTSACQAGFLPGTLFTGNGVPGQIARISPDGTTVTSAWATLPGETGLMRGSLFQDRYCVFGGDLIVVTTAGGVWRVTAAGVGTKLAQINTHLEGVHTIPNDARYGPWAGKILIGAEAEGRLYTVDSLGAVAFYALGIAPEDIDIVPAGENFFGVNYPSAIQGAAASQWTDKVGDVIVTQESPGILWDVRWDPVAGAFEKYSLATVGQWEHVTFSSAGIVEIPPGDTTPPSCVITTKTSAGITVTVRDMGSGLGSIVVTKNTNATVTWPPFTVGTTSAVVVTALKNNLALSSTVALRVTDVAGNITLCDPVLTTTVRENGSPATETHSGLPQAESKVWIQNGRPGVNRLDITVNGKTWKLTGLKAGQEISLDVASAMVAGDNNTISVTAHGKPGGTALVVISD